MLQKDYTDHQHVYFTIKISNNNIVINFFISARGDNNHLCNLHKSTLNPSGNEIKPQYEHAHSDHNLNMWGILLFSTYFLWYQL